MLLTEQNHKADVPEAFNPYTKAGARNVARILSAFGLGGEE